MGHELRLHLDQHLLDRLEAVRLLSREATPTQALREEELFQMVLERGINVLLQDLLVGHHRRFSTVLTRSRRSLLAARVA